MTDLISRRAAIKAIDDLPNCYNGYSDTYDKACIIGVLEELPSVDVPDRKVGKWEHHIGIGNVALLKCGECGFTYPELLGMTIFNFCPNCGAKMERSEDGET